MQQSLFCFWSSLFCSVRDLCCKILPGKWIKKWPGLARQHTWLGSNWKSHPASSLELISGSGRSFCLSESSDSVYNISRSPGVPRSFALSPGSPLTQPCAGTCKGQDYKPGPCYEKQNSHARGCDDNSELLCGVFLPSRSRVVDVWYCAAWSCWAEKHAALKISSSRDIHHPAPAGCWRRLGPETLSGRVRTSSAPLSCMGAGTPGVVRNQGACSPFWLLVSCGDVFVCVIPSAPPTKGAENEAGRQGRRRAVIWISPWGYAQNIYSISYFIDEWHWYMRSRWRLIFA